MRSWHWSLIVLALAFSGFIFLRHLDQERTLKQSLAKRETEYAAAERVHQEEPPSEYAGECWGGGHLLWSGTATDFDFSNTPQSQGFINKVTGRRTVIEGDIACVWSKNP